MNALQIKDKIAMTLQNMSNNKLDSKLKLFRKVDLPIIRIQYIERQTLSKKRLRLYLDLIDTWYPLDRLLDNEAKASLISDIFKCVCTEQDLVRLKSFKDINTKEVIIVRDETIKTIKRLRWRGRDAITKNIIHFHT